MDVAEDAQPTGRRRPRVLISYRRADSAGHAGRLYDRLAEHFGDDQVFMDLTGIGAGEDFVAAIEREVAGADSVIVLIGREWLTTTDERGRRRLEDPEDFVHLEVQAALRRDLHVIPVLVEGTAMPSPAELPPGLSSLARRNAQELSDARWRYDTGELIAAIERRAAGREAAESPPPPGPAARAPAAADDRRRRGAIAAVIGVVAVVAIVLVAVLLLGGGDDDGGGDDGGEVAEANDGFVVAPGSIAFSGQSVGTAGGEVAVTVSNTGPEPFTLEAIKVYPEGSPFVLDDADCLQRALGPGDPSCELLLGFAPTSPGTQEAELLVREQVNSVTRRVALTGEALEVPEDPSSPPVTTPEAPPETTGTAPVIPPEDLPEGFEAPVDENPPATQ